MVAAVHFVAVLLGVAAADIVPDEYFEGDGTSYTLSEVSSGNCNFMSAIPTASTNFVALNEEQWNTLGNCGRCIEVSCIDVQCTVQNKTAVVQVLDRCPECAHGALDLSPTVFSDITGLGPNRLTVRWRFVDCPDAGNVQVCLKEGSSSSWIAVQPTNGLVGIQSVTLNGATTTMLDGAYFYVSTTAKADLSAVKVAITSVNGDVISGTYSLSVGKCTDTMQQFTSGSLSQTKTQTILDTTEQFASVFSIQTETQTTVDTTDTPAPTPAPTTTKTTTVTPTSEYTPVVPEAQEPSKGATPAATTLKATTATYKDTPSTEAISEAPSEYTPVTPTSKDTPVTPEAQGTSKGATPAATTPKATIATHKGTLGAVAPPETTTATSESTSEYSPVTPEAQEPSKGATLESTTPKAMTATHKGTLGAVAPPETTTAASESTSQYTPVVQEAQGTSEGATPESNTRKDKQVTPETQEPNMEATSKATSTSPEATTATDAPPQSGDTPMCHV
ncbi:unnamed protein product [Peronospora farinosa]|uniref:Expansin-like EG45 domain-containing protein n=1 Tax=Peronospora farinosa TaxID=134698 RepID=A0AAV0TRA7_9STRA|nr:unnamed protein product [Peronospora farinosa]CAI5724576.1 unnamed protein product [Peronospora farinosa]